MSGQNASIGSIVLGVVIGVVAISTGQYYMLLTSAVLIAGGAYGLTYKPKSADQNQAQAQELQVATASIGNPIPVVFGEARVTPNLLRHELSTFRNRPVYADEQASGGKGGSKKQPKQLAGYDYFLTWEQGLCMGPIDMVGQVFSMPGDVPMIDSDDPWVAPVDGLLTLVLDNEDADSPEEGVCRLYQGTADQEREGTDDPYFADGIPYQNQCWVLMGLSRTVEFEQAKNSGTFEQAGFGFLIGRFAQPKTYQFLIRRLPKCIRDDGSTVATIKTRGSSDPMHPSYHQANPAAIAYEIITNKLWGRQLSSDICKEGEFETVSDYYESKNIGMSVVMEAGDGIGAVLEGLYRHCKALITWDGEQYGVIALTNQSQTHSDILTLNENDLVNLTLNVPLWETSTKNELRAEFTSSARGYRPDIAHVQDLANVDILGGRNVSERIQLPGFVDHNLAFQQAARILSEQSYPFPTAQWEMNRFNSHVAVGQVVRIIWREFTDTVVTGYWMVLKIEQGASDAENIMVTAIQDQLLFPVEGEETDVEVPATHPWERLVERDRADIYIPPTTVLETDPVEPITAFEMPAIVTAGLEHRTLITGERMAPFLAGLQGSWSLDDVEFFGLGSAPSFSITGELAEALPGFEGWNRSEDGFGFTLTNADLWGAAILAYNQVQLDTDNLWRLMFDAVSFLLVEEEVIQVGLVVLRSEGDSDEPAIFAIRNIIRGRFGTRARYHPVGSTMFFVPGGFLGFSTSEIPQNRDIWFKGIPIGPRGPTADGDSFQPFHHAPNDGLYLGVGIRPLPPRPVDIGEDGDMVEIHVRPRYYDKGGGTQDFVDALKNPVESLGAMTFAVQQLDNTGTAIDEVPQSVEFSFMPPTMSEPSLVVVTLEPHPDAVVFRVFSRLEGQTSVEYAEFNFEPSGS